MSRTIVESVKAKRAQLELAGVLGQTVARAEIEETILGATRVFRDALLRRWRTLAVELEGRSAAEIEARGIASDQVPLADLVREIAAGMAARSEPSSSDERVA